MKVRFTQQAARQYVEALEYIRTSNPGAAETVQRHVEDLVKLLSEHPYSGHVIPEFPELPHREHPVPPNRFFYRVVDDTVWITGVWHARQLSQS